jgi:hypothetical protein
MTPKLLPLLALVFAACAGRAAPSTTPDARPQPIVNPTQPDDPPIDEPQIDVQALRAAITDRRAQQVDRLLAYSDRGIFPVNTYSDQVINVFRDDSGTLCAVANLVSLDGYDTLVADTARANNFVRFAELTDGPLHDWIFTSGFTQAELAAIQLPDMPIRDEPDFRITEQQRLRQHLLTMHAQLNADIERSVESILTLLLEKPELHATLTALNTPARVFASAP